MQADGESLLGEGEIKGNEVEFRADDGRWYDARLRCNRREGSLEVIYGSDNPGQQIQTFPSGFLTSVRRRCALERRIRARSYRGTAANCPSATSGTRVNLGMTVRCAFRDANGRLREYRRATIVDVMNQHQENLCQCRFKVRWLETPKAALEDGKRAKMITVGINQLLLPNNAHVNSYAFLEYKGLETQRRIAEIERQHALDMQNIRADM